MADKEVINNGATRTVLHTETDGTMHVEEWQDAEPILEYAHAARNHRFSADACDGMFRHEAEIPVVIFQEECWKRGVRPFSPESDLVMEAILADPKYAKFRAAPRVADPRIIIKGAR